MEGGSLYAMLMSTEDVASGGAGDDLSPIEARAKQDAEAARAAQAHKPARPEVAVAVAVVEKPVPDVKKPAPDAVAEKKPRAPAKKKKSLPAPPVLVDSEEDEPTQFKAISKRKRVVSDDEERAPSKGKKRPSDAVNEAEKKRPKKAVAKDKKSSTSSSSSSKDKDKDKDKKKKKTVVKKQPEEPSSDEDDDDDLSPTDDDGGDVEDKPVTANRKSPGFSMLRIDRGRIKRAIESHQNRRQKRLEQAGSKKPTTTVCSMLTDGLLQFWEQEVLSKFDDKFGSYMQD